MTPERCGAKCIAGREGPGQHDLCAIEEPVRADGGYPAQWRPDEPFDGGLIEYRQDGSCRVYWKVEAGLQRFKLDAVQEYGSPRDAAPTFVRRLFGNNIDGVPINWKA